ncbi:MaoC family dehydratase N-terminal domain-containing protein [Solirubrobacter phytolaccae]|uniref:MaoC family dehydratase N-terminal domain-containing protein n=1 Tax=Solirubrobacter phytolaccae TaxID=1404360 RepID=A0A9X3NIG5_9ACTN|nr:MaoC family dehydratase N-terminal domain-containing protein [Solirubrobacter phytolaccae]MDA0181902.1 MaoC family dehydratase N-terminal domain-containing protein [Solirubrobacter phytolaccae]
MHELIQRGPAEALAGLLGVPMPRETLPLLWHWLYLLDRPAQAELGPDGHPAEGVEPGRRRMWAGGRVRSVAPLRFDEPATRRRQVLDTVDKQGRSGHLTFVTVGVQVFQRGELVVDERQDLVYRDPPSEPLAREEVEAVQPRDGDWSIDVTAPLLFRFSALTYNGHRIHYDRDYAREVEGYPGLVTHGPLQALAMAEAARARDVGGHEIEYRLLAPLFEHQGLVVRADASGFAVHDRGGRQTARATIT